MKHISAWSLPREHRKEQVDVASLIKAQTKQQLEQNATAVHKQSSPAQLWIAVLLIVLVIIALLIIKLRISG